MPTKAELEQELAELKAELAALRPEAVSDAEPTAAMDVFEALKGGDFEGLANELTKEIEDVMNDKPLLTAAGLLLLGYALGRAR